MFILITVPDSVIGMVANPNTCTETQNTHILQHAVSGTGVFEDFFCFGGNISNWGGLFRRVKH